MADDVAMPATEIEIAETLRTVSDRNSLTIRKLAFERDRLKECLKNIESAASSIIDNWDEWDGEAQQSAQHDQDDNSWRFVMFDHILSTLRRNLCPSHATKVVGSARSLFSVRDRVRVRQGMGCDAGHYGTITHVGGDDGRYYGVKLDCHDKQMGYSEYELEHAKP